jgi:hypothetical protein
MILRLCAGIDGRPERCGSGRGIEEARAAGKVFREVASGAKSDRAQRLDQLGVADVLMVTRLDRLARSTRDDTYNFGYGASRRTSAAGLSSRTPS